MDHHIKEFYRQSSDESPSGNFHRVISLNDTPDLDWVSIKQKVPNICKGWYELSHLNSKDRIEFNRDFWLSKLSYHPHLSEFLENFFKSLDDIGIYITQKKFDDPYEAHLVYSIKDDSGFYSGSIPATENDILEIQNFFPDYTLPQDYVAFLQIHNGFCKTTDCTGIIPTTKIFENYQILQKLIEELPPKEGLKDTNGKIIDDPRSLIPFYASFGMPYYQCFWAAWYPEMEMGNVYFSGENKTISDISNGDLGPESMAFPTFTDWLMFYLEQVE